MEGLMIFSGGWEQQLVQLSKILAILTTANELERTGVGVAESRSEADFRIKQDILQNVADLVCLIQSENGFVRHSMKKILIALSDYLILRAQMSSWCSLLNHIWNVISQECDEDGNKDKGVLSSVNLPIGLEAIYCQKSWDPVVCGLEIVRCILKSCVHENETVDEHTEVFLGIFAENIDDVVKMTCRDTASGGDSLCSERGLVWGALLQLLCTVIGCCDQEAEYLSFTNTELQLILIEKIGGCIPLCAGIALSPHKHSKSVLCPSSFLRHKILRLMIGLSRWFEMKPTVALQCLRALRKDGADLTGFSLMENGSYSRENSLMRSPFLTSFVHPQGCESLPRSATHLQCRAIYLLFRVWSLVAKEFDLNQDVRKRAFQQIDFKRSSAEDRKELEDPAPLTSSGVHHHVRDCSNTCSRDGGRSADAGNIQDSCQCGLLAEKYLKHEAIAAIHEWLRLQSDAVSADGLEEFSMAFVGLYLDEDDLMIETLLMLAKLRSSFLGLHGTILAIATALSPAELFQAFLQMLTYDHTVLVDFLISGSTGTLFLRYLMLCTGLFIKPGTMELSRESSSLALSKESLNCLSQLKAAIERLCRRDLFPYNPSSLLKRLIMLEESQQRV